MNIPATGQQVAVPGIIIYRIADGKIVEHWMLVDWAVRCSSWACRRKWRFADQADLCVVSSGLATRRVIMSDIRLRVGIVGCGYQGGILAQTIIEATRRCASSPAPIQIRPRWHASPPSPAARWCMPRRRSCWQCTDVDAVFVATSHNALYECSLCRHPGRQARPGRETDRHR